MILLQRKSINRISQRPPRLLPLFLLNFARPSPLFFLAPQPSFSVYLPFHEKIGRETEKSSAERSWIVPSLLFIRYGKGKERESWVAWLLLFWESLYEKRIEVLLLLRAAPFWNSLLCRFLRAAYPRRYFLIKCSLLFSPSIGGNIFNSQYPFGSRLVRNFQRRERHIGGGERESGVSDWYRKLAKNVIIIYVITFFHLL